MMILWGSVLLALLATAHGCPQPAIEACSATLKEKYHLEMGAGAQVFPSLEEGQLEEFCKDYDAFRECVDPLIAMCDGMAEMEIIKAVLEGEDDAMDFACSEEGKTIYHEEGLSECYASPAMHDATTKCSEEVMMDFVTDICRGINKLLCCINKAAEAAPLCNEASISWTHEFNSRAITPMADMMNCEVNEIEEPMRSEETEHKHDSDERGGKWGFGGHRDDNDSDEKRGWWKKHHGDHDSHEKHHWQWKHDSSESGSHQHGGRGMGSHHEQKKKRGLVIGLACGASALILLLVGLAAYLCYHSSRAGRRRTQAVKAARMDPYVKKAPIPDGVDNPAYVIPAAPGYNEKSVLPPEYRSQVSLNGWTGPPADDDKFAPPEYQSQLNLTENAEAMATEKKASLA